MAKKPRKEVITVSEMEHCVLDALWEVAWDYQQHKADQVLNPNVMIEFAKAAVAAMDWFELSRSGSMPSVIAIANCRHKLRGTVVESELVDGTTVEDVVDKFAPMPKAPRRRRIS